MIPLQLYVFSIIHIISIQNTKRETKMRELTVDEELPCLLDVDMMQPMVLTTAGRHWLMVGAVRGGSVSYHVSSITDTGKIHFLLY